MEIFENETFQASGNQDPSLWKGNEFLDCTFEGLELAEMELRSSRFIECKFENCNLSNAVLVGSSFRSVSFTDCKLVGVNFSAISSQMDLSFRSCLMNYSVFQELKLTSTPFVECVMKNADFSNALLKEADFSLANLEGANFSGCNLEGADFRGADKYFIDIRQCRLKGAKFSVPQALNLLSSLNLILE